MRKQAPKACTLAWALTMGVTVGLMGGAVATPLQAQDTTAETPQAATDTSAAAEIMAKPLTLELNKIESSDTGQCTLTWLVDNGGSTSIAMAQYRVGFFDQNGIIMSLNSLPFAKLPPLNASIFKVPLPFACDDLGKVLIDDVVACQDDSGGETDLCGFDMLDMRSRTDVIVSAR